MEDPTSVLFQRALGLVPPWEVANIAFDAERHRLDINSALNGEPALPARAATATTAPREQRTAPGLKNSRYTWLKKPSKLTTGQKQDLLYLRDRYRQTGRAYELKLKFDDMWSLSADWAPGYLVAWCSEVRRSGLEPLKAFADSIDKHRYDVLRWFRTHISIGVLEANNGLVQAAKRRARGYRTDRHYIAMIYMTAGKLNFGLPT